jgi:hypothetical protein
MRRERMVGDAEHVTRRLCFPDAPAQYSDCSLAHFAYGIASGKALAPTRMRSRSMEADRRPSQTPLLSKNPQMNVFSPGVLLPSALESKS